MTQTLKEPMPGRFACFRAVMSTASTDKMATKAACENG
jgi:hypothetical protein